MTHDCAVCPELDYTARLRVALRHCAAVAHHQSRHEGEWTRCQKQPCVEAIGLLAMPASAGPEPAPEFAPLKGAADVVCPSCGAKRRLTDVDIRHRKKAGTWADGRCQSCGTKSSDRWSQSVTRVPPGAADGCMDAPGPIRIAR